MRWDLFDPGTVKINGREFKYFSHFAFLPRFVFKKEGEPKECLIWLEPYWRRMQFDNMMCWYKTRKDFHKDGLTNGTPDETDTK